MKTKIAIILLSGLWVGGVEKCTQLMAIEFARRGYEVDYFYSESTRYLPHGIIHPGLDSSRKLLVEKAGVRTIKFSCEDVGDLKDGAPWFGSDIKEVFDPTNYDIVFGAHKGEPCYPFSEMKGTKIVEIVHGSDFTNGASQYADAYVLLSEYQLERWMKSGGRMEKTYVIPQIVPVEEAASHNDRSRWGIPDGKTVFGMHQSARQGLHSPLPLAAYSKIESDKNFFVLLGGDPEYTRQAKSLGIKNFLQIGQVSKSSDIQSFLSCLDVYAHGRFDGEVCSSAIIEAMAESLPIITHPSSYNNGHLHQVKQCGIVVTSSDEYAQALSVLENDAKVREALSLASRAVYDSVYSEKRCSDKLIELVESLTMEAVTVRTDFEYAVDSDDYKIQAVSQRDFSAGGDNNTSAELISRIVHHFSDKVEFPRMLDLGCAGGQLVIDCISTGKFGLCIGIDGVAGSLEHKNWKTRGQDPVSRVLFSADLTKSWEVVDKNNKKVLFDVITSWDVIEHFRPEDLELFFKNAVSHLAPGGIFIGSISLDEDFRDSAGFTSNDPRFDKNRTPLYRLHNSVFTIDHWREAILKDYKVTEYPFRSQTSLSGYTGIAENSRINCFWFCIER